MESDGSETPKEIAPPRRPRRGQALFVAIAIIALIGLAFGLSPFMYDALASERWRVQDRGRQATSVLAWPIGHEQGTPERVQPLDRLA